MSNDVAMSAANNHINHAQRSHKRQKALSVTTAMSLIEHKMTILAAAAAGHHREHRYTWKTPSWASLHLKDTIVSIATLERHDREHRYAWNCRQWRGVQYGLTLTWFIHSINVSSLEFSCRLCRPAGSSVTTSAMHQLHFMSVMVWSQVKLHWNYFITYCKNQWVMLTNKLWPLFLFECIV